MNGWMLSYKHPDTERMFSRTYLKEASAYNDAAESIAGWVMEELTNAQGDPDRADDIESLREILDLTTEGKHKEAYLEWREYADNAGPDEDVMIEDTQIVEE